LTGFVVHGSEVSTLKGVYCIKGRGFYTVLRVACFILFSEMCRSEI